MKKIFLCLYMCSNFLFVISWEPTADYCKVKCKGWGLGNFEHSACNCKLLAPLKEVFDGLLEFRRAMVDTHNELRNKIASGDQDGYPPASNMMAINYDMELEYIARCAARKFEENHDKCRDKADTPGAVGQNMAGETNPAKLVGKNVVESVRRWYNECTDVSGDKAQFIKEFSSKSFKPNQPIGHFTEMIWWSVTLIGCGRVHNPKPKNRGWGNTLICDYGGAETLQDSPNMDKQPIYKAGKPCSACPHGTSCLKQYKSLCGKIEPIPNDAPTEISGGSTIHKHKLLVFVCVLRFLLALFENLR